MSNSNASSSRGEASLANDPGSGDNKSRMENSQPSQQAKMAASGDAVGSGVGEVGPNDRTEGDPTGARPASSRSTRAAGPTLRAHVGIDAATRTPVFRGAERAGDEEDQYDDDVGNSASVREALDADAHANAVGDSAARSMVPGAGMKVKEYFTNFDTGDALGMMSPYMAACAQLLDIEYIISSLVDIDMLENYDDPVMLGLNNYMDGLVAMVKDVGVEPDRRFLANLRTQDDLDDLFALAQESVVLDAMSSAGKLFAAAVSAKKRRETILQTRQEDEEVKNDHGDEDVQKMEEASMDTLCTAAEYFTKLFRKVTAQEDEGNLDLQVALIDRVSTLSTKINAMQKNACSTSGMRASDNLSARLASPEAEWVKSAKAAAEEAAKARGQIKYTPLNDKEVLMTIGEVLPELIADEKLLQPGTSSLATNSAIATIAEKLMEKHLEKVPEEEKFTAEAAKFVRKYGDERAAVQALVLLADELNDFLSRLVIDGEDDANDVTDDECDYEAEVEELEEGQAGEESSVGEGSPDGSGVEEGAPH